MTDLQRELERLEDDFYNFDIVAEKLGRTIQANMTDEIKVLLGTAMEQRRETILALCAVRREMREGRLRGGAWQCDHCHCLCAIEQEVRCWECGIGQMVYIPFSRKPTPPPAGSAGGDKYERDFAKNVDDAIRDLQNGKIREFYTVDELFKYLDNFPAASEVKECEHEIIYIHPRVDPGSALGRENGVCWICRASACGHPSPDEYWGCESCGSPQAGLDKRGVFCKTCKRRDVNRQHPQPPEDEDGEV
jgi:hypothetical protein